MARGVRYKVKFKRRRKGITDFRKRYRELKSGEFRLVARVLSNNIIAQIVKYDPKGDKTLVNTSSLELKHYGWQGHGGNLSAAYLTGLLCGIKAKEKNIKKAILDTGLHTPVKKSNVFGVLKGAIDAGLEIPHEEKILPKDERISTKANFSEVKEKILSKKPDVVVKRVKK